MRFRFFSHALIFFCLSSLSLFAQETTPESSAVVYEVIYDEPFAVNKLFIHFQPLYGELFSTNTNAGFGFKVDYYLRDKADFSASTRKSYGRQFFDLTRDQAYKNSDTDNHPGIFNYYELGGTYHIKDFEVSGKTKMVLYKDSLRGNAWASRVPLNAVVPCKVRKIVGARLGGIFWDSSVDMDRVNKKQGLTNSSFSDDESFTLPNDISAYTNISSAGIYVGGSIAWIKNVAATFDKYDDSVDDMMVTTYLDLLFSPSLTLDDIVYTERDGSGSPVRTSTYSVDPVSLSKIGFRAGVEGKFNRQLSWAYGGEFGYRPSVKGMSFFACVKISIPVFSSNLEYQVESFGK